MKKTMFIASFILCWSLLKAQPVPDCAQSLRRLFIKSNDSMLSNLPYFGTTPSYIGNIVKCFAVETNNKPLTHQYFIEVKLYPKDAYHYWDDEPRKELMSMTVRICTENNPATFDYYIHISKYEAGIFCVDVSDKENTDIIQIDCSDCFKKINALEVTPKTWKRCLPEKKTKAKD
jgi:hypothetical protein